MICAVDVYNQLTLMTSILSRNSIDSHTIPNEPNRQNYDHITAYTTATTTTTTSITSTTSTTTTSIHLLLLLLALSTTTTTTTTTTSTTSTTTTTVIVERLGTAKGGQRPQNAVNAPAPIPVVDDSMVEDDDEDDDDIYDEDTYEVEDDDFFEEPIKAVPKNHHPIPVQLGQGLIAKTRGLVVETKEDMQTPVKTNRVPVVRESPVYHGLQDPPTPTGRLSDRIERLRQRCIEALGRDAFNEAYTFLKTFDDQYTSSAYEDDREDDKMNKMKAILGDSKSHYTPLIEQLIFMEETHSG